MIFYDNLEAYIKGQRDKIESLYRYNIPERGIILKVLAPNENQDKIANVANYSVTNEAKEIEIDFLGILGDRHHRAFRPSTGRERSLYTKGTLIREHRHVFAVSPYDCKVLSDSLGIEVTPELLGANLVIGREDGKDYSLCALPENTYLLIGEEGVKEITKTPIATLKHFAIQQGCGITGNTLAKKYGDERLTQKFIASSKNNRGIVLSVEQPVETSSKIKPNQKVFFKFPMGVTP